MRQRPHRSHARPGCNDVCVLISKSELEALEQAWKSSPSLPSTRRCGQHPERSGRVRRLPAAGGRGVVTDDHGARGRLRASTGALAVRRSPAGAAGVFRSLCRRSRRGSGRSAGALPAAARHGFLSTPPRTRGRSTLAAPPPGCAVFQSSAFRSATTALILPDHLRRRPRARLGVASSPSPPARGTDAPQLAAAQSIASPRHTAAQGRAVPQGHLARDFVRRRPRPRHPRPPPRPPTAGPAGLRPPP